jgi:hypothetical protein
MTLGKSAHSLLLEKIMSRTMEIAVAALDVEVAILKLQIALAHAECLGPVKEELEQSLRLARGIKATAIGK